MELDVHITRDGCEQWGFELVGGADCDVPLTVDQVAPCSPAAAAGLQPGDIVARLGDHLTAELTREQVAATIADAVGSVSVGVIRGLYDPVLDDFEPIYESIERADSDRPSEPTEVPDLSLYNPNIDPNVDPHTPDPSLWDSGYTTRPVTETRSMTASPFVPNSKPYRPFSTEPLEVPPLDDPIILNPNYKDNFMLNGKIGPEEEDLLRLLPLDKNVEAKFKLPVSEKYDPDWDKKVKALLENCTSDGKRDSKQIEQELAEYSSKSEIAADNTVIKDIKNVKVSKGVTVSSDVAEIRVIEKETKHEEMRKDFEIRNIEQTALEIVEESIERAVSVTEDIHKEIEEERASMVRELQTDEVIASSETNIQSEEIRTKEEKSVIKKKQDTIQMETEIKKELNQDFHTDITEHEEIQQTNVNEERKLSIKKGVEEIKEKLPKDDTYSEERRFSVKKEAEKDITNDETFVKTKTVSSKNETEETTENVTVSRKPSVIENGVKNIKESLAEEKHLMEESRKVDEVKRQSMYLEQESEQVSEMHPKLSQAKETRSGYTREAKSSETFSTEALKSESKQKAYMIGLQTIPHIKGFVQSSYHFDLLLRTFFVHLTDVMVALSRFILTQPAQELEIKAEKVIKEQLVKEFDEHNIKTSREETEQKHEERKQSVQSFKDNKLERKNYDTEMVQSKKQTATVDLEAQQEKKEIKKESHESKVLQQENVEANIENTVMRKSGAEMAQRTQRKSRDLTQKMDAVISEFEIKTGIEDRLEITEQRNRRSRSRSQIEEEVMRESDPLEWLDKVDSRRASQERTDITVEKGFSSHTESLKRNKSETKCESRSITKVKPDKQMYVAIVESHVYTNVDAILEDQAAEISETASVQSSEEINAASESFEAVSSENVAISNMIQNDEKQQAVEIITNALEEVVHEKQEILESVHDYKSAVVQEHSATVIQESQSSIAVESTEVVSETKKVSTEESKALVLQEENFKTAAVEIVDVPLETSEEVIIETEMKQEAISKQEMLTTVAAETTEIVDESTLESFKAKEIISKQAVVSSEESYKTAAESTTEITLETNEEKSVKLDVKEAQAISKVESLAIAVAESTDVVVDDSKVESFVSQELVSKKAQLKSEESFKTAAVGITDVTFETAEDKHSETFKTSEITIKEEAPLAVAGIIETKAEVCKEPKKPAEDGYASLKIVKEQIIDGGESIEISQSELNVKESLEVDISSTHHQAISESYQSISKESSSVQEMCSSVQKLSSSVQESSISMQESKSTKSLHIDTSLAQQMQSEQIDENNNTPTPSTVPPTPLTDEYVFRLEIPLPKNEGTVVIEESPDREDPHIVKKGLIPHVEIKVEDQIVYDPPLPTPPEDKVQSPVYTKPGLKGGATPSFKNEYIREIERKSSLLASAIDETIKSIEEYKEEVGIETVKTFTFELSKKIKEINANGTATEENANEKENELTLSTEEGDALPGFKPVVFNPEAYQAKLYEEVTKDTVLTPVEVKPYLNESGEPLGTVQGIVDGLEEATVDEEVAKELGKPGMTEEKIAELISGESEMLREAHVMGLSRVITSHMTRADDSSVDFQKIKPLYESLKDSEVLKALNEEIKREVEEKKKKEEKWTTFLQKPKRPVPKAKFGYVGCVESEEEEEPYKVKIVKQPKPKVAPDYKPEDFDTGPLPWEQRALTEPVPSPVPPEEPILVPEEAEFFEAVDPLPESEVPDLEDTGIPLPATPPVPTFCLPEPPPELPDLPDLPEQPKVPELPPEPEVKEPPNMDQSSMAEQLVNTVRDMVDPNAPLEQQLCQMRAQLDALAQLPCVIQQSLEVLTRQLTCKSRQEAHVSFESERKVENHQETHEEYQSQAIQNNHEQKYEEVTQNGPGVTQNGHEEIQKEEQNSVTIEELKEEMVMSAEEAAALKREQDAIIEEQRKSEKEKKEREEKLRLDQESRQVKQRAPRVGKPRPVFGPLSPEERPLVLPGGRRWRGPKDAYNEQLIAETIQAQSEILQGKVMGFESDRLPYDTRINFMKFERPPVSLEHLKNSATYKLIHNMEEAPLKRTDLLTPVVAEADYRERCRSMTPVMQSNGRV